MNEMKGEQRLHPALVATPSVSLVSVVFTLAQHSMRIDILLPIPTHFLHFFFLILNRIHLQIVIIAIIPMICLN